MPKKKAIKPKFTTKQLIEAVGVTRQTICNYKKVTGFPHNGTLEQAVSFCKSVKSTKGRKTDASKAGLVTTKDSQDWLIRKKTQEYQINQIKIEKEQRKIIDKHNEVLTTALDEFVGTVIKDLRVCKLPKNQISIIQRSFKKGLEQLQGQLKASLQV